MHWFASKIADFGSSLSGADQRFSSVANMIYSLPYLVPEYFTIFQDLMDRSEAHPYRFRFKPAGDTLDNLGADLHRMGVVADLLRTAEQSEGTNIDRWFCKKMSEMSDLELQVLIDGCNDGSRWGVDVDPTHSVSEFLTTALLLDSVERIKKNPLTAGRFPHEIPAVSGGNGGGGPVVNREVSREVEGSRSDDEEDIIRNDGGDENDGGEKKYEGVD